MYCGLILSQPTDLRQMSKMKVWLRSYLLLKEHSTSKTVTFKWNTDMYAVQRNAAVYSLLNSVEVEDWERQNITLGEGKRSKIGIKDCACVHCHSLLMMMQINIYTRGTDNGDMEFVSHMGVMEDVSCLWREGLLPGEEVPDFTGTHRVLQCCTLSGVISHKASLILQQEQLKGLFSEIKRCTIHFLCITSLIIHLNCSEGLNRAKCQVRCWSMDIHACTCSGVVKGEHNAEGTLCVTLCFGSQRVQWGHRRRLVTERPDLYQHEHPEQVCGSSAFLIHGWMY